jgi:hypothetical protein
MLILRGKKDQRNQERLALGEVGKEEKFGDKS